MHTGISYIRMAPLMFTQNPRSKKRNNTLEKDRSNPPNQGPWEGGTIYNIIYIDRDYIYIYICIYIYIYMYTYIYIYIMDPVQGTLTKHHWVSPTWALVSIGCQRHAMPQTPFRRWGFALRHPWRRPILLLIIHHEGKTDLQKPHYKVNS